MFSLYNKDIFEDEDPDDSQFKSFYQIPPKSGRYIAFDTEINNYQEMSAREIEDGIITGEVRKISLHKRTFDEERLINKLGF